MEDDKTYQKGFNDGYMLKQYEPEIANILNRYWQKLRHNKEVVVTTLPFTDKTIEGITSP